MELVNTAVFGLLSVASLVIFIIVLLKSFKEGGVVHGILGILTCGLYTYIWGWLKSKQLQLVKLMLLWTIVWVLSFAMPIIVGTSALMQAIPMAADLGIIEQPAPKMKPLQKRSKSAQKSKKSKARTAKKGKPKMAKPADPNSRALALWKKGKFKKPNQAVNLLGKVIKQNPDFAPAYNNRGNAYRDLRQYAKAIQDYNRAISLDPKFAKAYNNRGNVYFDQKNFQMAIRNYNQSVSVNPDYKLAYVNRGLAYHQLKQNQLACKDFKKACQMGVCSGIRWARKQGICK
jgi:tetratricopeptide (TPR) repeat protein